MVRERVDYPCGMGNETDPPFYSLHDSLDEISEGDRKCMLERSTVLLMSMVCRIRVLKKWKWNNNLITV